MGIELRPWPAISDRAAGPPNPSIWLTVLSVVLLLAGLIALLPPSVQLAQALRQGPDYVCITSSQIGPPPEGAVLYGESPVEGSIQGFPLQLQCDYSVGPGQERITVRPFSYFDPLFYAGFTVFSAGVVLRGYMVFRRATGRTLRHDRR